MTSRLRTVVVALSLLGVGIAGYLSWVKLSDTEAFCGGVGDCSTVQNSIYAYFLGIPVAYLGLLCYLALLALALYNRWKQPERGSLPDLAFFAVAAGGVAFSAYLTYTELFLLREVCPWCVASFINLIVLLAMAALLVFGQEVALEEA